MHYPFVIVGAGFTGAVLAERLSSHLGKKILVIENRPHIAGNAYDEYDEWGVLIHRYGPHIFHTNHKKVIDYLSHFTKWRPYEHHVISCVDGQFYPFPINRLTLNKLYNLQLEHCGQVEAYYQKVKCAIKDPSNAEEKVLSQIGRDLYLKFFLDYTKKQWGRDPKDLAPSVTARIPVRTCDDCRYFTDQFQCIPEEGYTKMFEKMLSNPLITLALNTSFEKLASNLSYDHLLYTGPIDAYFNYQLGHLPYRGLRFDFTHYPYNYHQHIATINFPDQRPYTRTTEFKHLTAQVCSGTTLCTEYPLEVTHVDQEKYYPVPSLEGYLLYKRYAILARSLKNVTFCGRLGDYKYYNMDHAVMRALTLFEHKFKKI